MSYDQVNSLNGTHVRMIQALREVRTDDIDGWRLHECGQNSALQAAKIVAITDCGPRSGWDIFKEMDHGIMVLPMI